MKKKKLQFLRNYRHEAKKQENLMKKRSFLTLLALAISLSGCVTTPRFHATEKYGEVVPNHWLGTANVDEHPAADLAQWWTTWSDPEISRLVEAARVSNTDILAAKENVRYADASMTVANAGLFPTLDGNYRGGRTHSYGHGANAFSIGLNVSWTIDAGGRYAATEAAFADYLSSEASLGDVQTRIASQVASAYVNLRLAQKRVQVAQRNSETQKEALDIANWRYLSGLVPSTDVDQARTSYEQTRASIPVYQAQLQQYRNLLARLTSKKPEDLDFCRQESIPQPPRNIALNIPGEVLRQRPAVRVAEANVIAALARHTQARSALFPSLSIGGSFGLSGPVMGKLGEAGTHNSNGFGSLTLPIFNAGSLMAQVEQRDAQAARAKIEYEASLLEGVRDVEDALNQIWSQEERKKSLVIAEKSARGAATAARQNYSAGLQDFTVVLSTQRTLLTVQESLASVEAEIAQGYINLYTAVGGGWNVPNEFRTNDKQI